MSWMKRLSENAPWPHSCAITHMPVHTQPVTAAYSSHRGQAAIVIGICKPRATHAAPSRTEMAAYLRERIVLRVKQWAGTAFFTSPFVGMSDFSTSMALPLRPLKPGRFAKLIRLSLGAIASTAPSTRQERHG